MARETPPGFMWTEILLPFADGGELFAKGETACVEEWRGKYFCDNGWAKDMDGKYSTATPNRGMIIIRPDNLTTKYG